MLGECVAGGWRSEGVSGWHRRTGVPVCAGPGKRGACGPARTGQERTRVRPSGALGPVLAVPEVCREGPGHRGQDRGVGDEQAELAVVVEGGPGEVLRSDDPPRVARAVVGLDGLSVDVESGGGAVVADVDS